MLANEDLKLDVKDLQLFLWDYNMLLHFSHLYEIHMNNIKASGLHLHTF